MNAMDLWQFTPLHEAASKNRVEVCSLLLSYGADPTLLNCHNKSTIDLAPTPQLKERLACEYQVGSVLQLQLVMCDSLDSDLPETRFGKCLHFKSICAMLHSIFHCL